MLSLSCADKPAPPPASNSAPPAPASNPPAAPAASPAAPDSFRVTFETSRGPFVVGCIRAWAPHGVDRFYQLVNGHFFDQTRFFRVVPGFVAQFGLSADPSGNAAWDAPIPDDSVRQSNKHGVLSFASQGPNTRTHQLFLNLADNAQLDGMGFPPICKVVEGLSAVDALYSGYGEAPDQTAIQMQGNAYLNRTFPKLDYIKTARITSGR
jgi:peptidyl-prolyl cis-trans isomerase A (cyclophilin A)